MLAVRPLCSRRLVRRPCRLHGQLLAPALSPRAHTCQAASARLALVFHQSTRSRARAPLATRPAAPVGSARPTLPDVRALGVPLLARSTHRAASARPALNFHVSWHNDPDGTAADALGVIKIGLSNTRGQTSVLRTLPRQLFFSPGNAVPKSCLGLTPRASRLHASCGCQSALYGICRSAVVALAHSLFDIIAARLPGILQLGLCSH
eukprot:6214207-Pleurochrysis_carterae.AAC.2